MNHKLLKNNGKSYLAVFLCGILAGVATRLTDYCGADTLWSFSSVATLYGFWIISVTAIVLLSVSNLCAGVGSFLYLFGMTISFYGLLYALGLYFPRFDNGAFKTTLFLVYTGLSAICGIGASALHFWEKNTRPGAVLYALPVGALLAEAAGTGVCLWTRSTFLFQFLMDILAAVGFGVLFFKRTSHKGIYGVAVLLVTAAMYMVIYRPFL